MKRQLVAAAGASVIKIEIGESEREREDRGSRSNVACASVCTLHLRGHDLCIPPSLYFCSSVFSMFLSEDNVH